MNITRRDFFKAIAAGALLGPSILSEGLPSQEVTWGNSLRSVADLTTLHRRYVHSLAFLDKALGSPLNARFAIGEPLGMRNDLCREILDPKAAPKTLLFFGQITDAHIVDEESPARLVAAEMYLEKLGVTSAFRPQEDLTPRVLDSMVETMNEIARRTQMDFLLNTGDSLDNAQKNETDWFLSALEGGEIDPDSGINEDPLAGPDNDANDSFIAKGLMASIPWYSAAGNHDLLLQGNVPFQYLELYNSIFKKIFDKLVLQNPVGNFSNAVLKPWTSPPDLSKLISGNVIADARRSILNSRDFLKVHWQKQSMRPVVGFPRNLPDPEFMYYSVYPKSGLPLKMIVLDTASRSGTALGTIDENQYKRFLIPELEKAKSNKELVMIVSHHPGDDIKTLSGLREEMYHAYGKNESIAQGVKEFFSQVSDNRNYISQQDFQDTLKSYPNVFLHVAGHKHSHKITCVGTQDRGYWEVQSASLLDYPQQSRLFEIVYEGNNVGAIHTCVVDHNSPAGSLASYSRSLAHKDANRDAQDYYAGKAEDRNTILRFSIPPEIAKKL